MPKKKRSKLRRRPYGRGSLFLREDGRIGWSWQDEGKRYQGSEATEAKAEAVLDATIERVKRGESPGAKQTLGEFMDEWLSLVVEPVRTKSTLKQYRLHSKNHIIKDLGERVLWDLTQENVQAFINALAKKQYRGRAISSRSIRNIHSILSAALKTAKRWRRIPENVAVGVVLPVPTPYPAQPYDEAELTHLLTLTRTHPFYPAFALSALLGLRAYEVCSLNRADFSEDFSLVKIEGYETEGGLRQTKTKASRRSLTVPAALAGVLKAHWEAVIQEDPGRIALFHDGRGNRLSPIMLNYHFRTAIKKHGLRQIHLHDLRHGFATLLLLRGVPVHVVSKLLGHSNAAITLKVYAHVLEVQETDAAKVMAAFLPEMSGL